MKAIVWKYKINVYFISAFFRSCEILLKNSETEFEVAKCVVKKSIKLVGLYTKFGCFSKNAYIFVEVFLKNGVMMIQEVQIFGSECLLPSKDLIPHEFLFESFKKILIFSIIFKNI